MTHELAEQALARDDYAAAEQALLADSAEALARQDLDGVFDARLMIAEVRKMAGESVGELEAARDFALGIANVAERYRLPVRIFEATTIAADCAYFAALAGDESDVHAYQARLLSTADLCVAALDRMEAGQESGYTNALVGLVVKLAHELGNLHWFDSDNAFDRTRVREALRRITLALESWVPVELPDGVPFDQVLQVGTEIAQLSYWHGSPDSARARLEGADRRAVAAGKLTARLDIAAIAYDGERNSARRSDQLRMGRRATWRLAEQWRTSYRSRAGRMIAAQRIEGMTAHMATDEFTSVDRDVRAAWSDVESNRARLLLDELHGCGRTAVDPSQAAALAVKESAALHVPVGERTSDLADEFALQSRLPVGGLDSAPAAADSAELLAELEADYRAADAGFDGAAATVGLDDIRSALHAGEALISYCIPYDALNPAAAILMIGVAHDRAFTRHLPIEFQGDFGVIGRIQVDGKQPLDASPLGNFIASTRHAVQEDDPDLTTDLKQLHRMLIDPLIELGVRPAQLDRLIIVPHGMLHAVPFAALCDADGRYLAEQVPTVIAPSGSAWATLAARALPAPQQFVGLGDPVLPADLADRYGPLDQAGPEVTEIAALLTGFRTTVLPGTDATEAALRRLAPQAGIVHLATHGDLPEQDPMDLHRLLLTPGDGEDGLVHAEEVRSLDLSRAALVTLSVCDGALFRFGPGDEPMGLLPAFLVAGATNVLAPLWAVEDSAAKALMIEFYRSLCELGPAAALQHAMGALRQAGYGVRDWAAFALFGAGRPFEWSTGAGPPDSVSA